MKLIVHIEDGIDADEALSHIQLVVEEGMISKSRGQKQYCFVTNFLRAKIVVNASRNKDTHTFKVSRSSEQSAIL